MFGLSEQLATTSLMAWQNKMALDMTLAEKRGVCTMIGPMCYTFIPNSTSPDGSVTRALERLKTLSLTMAKHSGINNQIDEWFTNYYVEYKAVVVSLLMFTAAFVAILTCCGCCFIPCLRRLINRLITTTLTREKDFAHLQLPLIQDEGSIEDRDSDEESDCNDNEYV